MTNDRLARIREWHAVLHAANEEGAPPDVQNASDLVGALGDVLAHMDTAISAEREACAKAAEEHAWCMPAAARAIAAAIRARK